MAPFADRRLQHDRRERVDQAGLFGEVDETVRHHAPVLRVVPAHQRLDTRHDVGRQVDDRLVVEAELVLVEPLPQLGDQRQTTVRVAILIGRVYRDPDAVALRDVHRDVRPLQQHLGRRAVFREAGDAEAGADAERAMIDDARLLDLVQHFLRREQRPVDVGDRQHDRELIATQARHRVGVPEHPAHPRRDALQDAIAGMMPQRVVDRLEAVEVEDQQRERGARAVGDAQRLRETIVQQQAVRQIGQRVVIRQVRETLLDAPPLAARAGLAQLALDCRRQALQPALEDVVARADPHRGDGGFFPARPRHDNERQVGVTLAHQIERHRGRQRGHRVFGDGDVPRLAFQRRGQRNRSVHALVHDVVAAARQRTHHERLVDGRVLDQQQSKQ